MLIEHNIPEYRVHSMGFEETKALSGRERDFSFEAEPEDEAPGHKSNIYLRKADLDRDPINREQSKDEDKSNLRTFPTI